MISLIREHTFALDDRKPTCLLIIHPIIEGRVTRIRESNSCRSLQIQHICLCKSQQMCYRTSPWIKTQQKFKEATLTRKKIRGRNFRLVQPFTFVPAMLISNQHLSTWSKRSVFRECPNPQGRTTRPCTDKPITLAVGKIGTSFPFPISFVAVIFPKTGRENFHLFIFLMEIHPMLHSKILSL